MSKLPPTEKLPLAIRKNVRDAWDSKKEEYQKELSDILGADWTFDINPNALFPYVTDDRQKDYLGNTISNYVKGAISQLQSFVENKGADGVTELNTICFAHQLTIDIDTEKRFSYCGVDINDGQLRLLFSEGNLGVNTDNTMDGSNLTNALNDAPGPAGADTSLSFDARTGIWEDYDSQIGGIQAKIAGLLNKDDINLTPNFESNFAFLKENNCDVRDWPQRLGQYTRCYFQGLAYQLDQQKFGEDNLLQEGFAEAVSSSEVIVRVVEKLEVGYYNECKIEDGFSTSR